MKSNCNHAAWLFNKFVNQEYDHRQNGTKPNKQLIINITLCEDLSESKEHLKDVNCFMTIFITSVFNCYGDLY